MSRSVIALLASRVAPATTTEGNLYSWGYGTPNYKLGSGASATRSSPVQVGIDSTWMQLAVGELHVNAIKADGSLWSWGSNALGQLGKGTSATVYSSPSQVGALTTWANVFSGYDTTLAIKTDGTLWAWGSNQFGSYGDGTTTTQSSPVQIGSGTSWANAAAGYRFTLGIKLDGTLWGCGRNNTYQLGVGNTTDVSTQVQIGSARNWYQCAAGYFSSAAIRTDGTLWVWGANNSGQLGVGDTTARTSPVQVGALTNWVYVVMGEGSAFGLKSDGTLWAWGANTAGQLGTGDTTGRSSPIQVGARTDWRMIANSKSGLGAQGAIGLTADGKIWAWGNGVNGNIGNGTTSNYSSPVQIGAGTDWTNVFGGGGADLAVNGLTMFATENASPLAVPPALPRPSVSGYGLYVMGDNSSGNLAMSSIGDVTRPVFISNGLRWRSISCLKNLTSFGVRSDGGLWTVGSAADGYLGTAIADPYTFSPQLVGSAMTWAEVSCGLAIRAGGLYSWGDNTYGQLGNGNTTDRSSPVQVGALTTWKTVSSNGITSAAIKTDGTLWTWGRNANGQLGSGSTTDRSSPVQVGALTNWSTVHVGADTTNVTVMAVKTDGTLWGWGYNTDGRIGDGSTTSRSSPVQVGAATTWSQATLGFALMTDKTLWKLETTLVQVAGSWLYISSSGQHQVGIKDDGTGWSWGLNDHGQLGLSDLVTRASPTQIPVTNCKLALAVPGASVVFKGI